MSTSGTYTFATNRDFIISEALKKAGALGDYETIDTQRQTVAINALNPMLKAFHGLGMPMWATTEVNIPFSFWSTGATQTIGPNSTILQIQKPLKILQALRKDGLIDVPLNIYTWTDYDILANKGSTGTPVHLFYQPLRTNGQISLWPIPDTFWQTKNLLIRYQREFQDMNVGTDELDFPVEWHEAIIYNLAVRIAPVYGLPPNDYSILKRDAQEALNLALSFDQEEGSLFIKPYVYKNPGY